MKRSLIILLSLLSLAAPAQNIASVWSDMPNYLIPYLSTNNRKDLVDLYRAGKTPTVENGLKGTSRLKMLTENFASIQLNGNSSLQLKMLPLNDTTKVVFWVKTVCGTACDSQLSAFGTDWKPLNSTQFTPVLSVLDFVINSANEELIRLVNASYISFSFDEKSSDLNATFDFKNLLSKEDFTRFANDIRPNITMKWVNGRFVKP